MKSCACYGALVKDIVDLASQLWYNGVHLASEIVEWLDRQGSCSGRVVKSRGDCWWWDQGQAARGRNVSSWTFTNDITYTVRAVDGVNACWRDGSVGTNGIQLKRYGKKMCVSKDDPPISNAFLTFVQISVHLFLVHVIFNLLSVSSIRNFSWSYCKIENNDEAAAWN